MRRLKPWMRKLLLAAGILTVSFVVALLSPSIFSILENGPIHSLIDGAGIFGPLVYMAILVVAVLISPFPLTPLMIIAVLLFGPVKTAIYSAIGGTIGSLLAFRIGRAYGRAWVEKRFGKVSFTEKLHPRKVALAIIVGRILPYDGADIIGYGAGLTRIKTRHFLLASVFGGLPGLIVFAAIGGSLVLGPGPIFVVTAGSLLFMVFVLPGIAQRLATEIEE